MEKVIEMLIKKDGAIQAGTCVCCNDKAEEFRDEISVKEYKISGLCQRCQDVFFLEEDDED